MPQLKDPRLELVAQARARGLSQEKSVVMAGFSKYSRNSICRKPNVLMRVKELNPDGGFTVPRPMPHNFGRGKSPALMTTEALVRAFSRVAADALAKGAFREANYALTKIESIQLRRDGIEPGRGAKTKAQRENEAMRGLIDEEEPDSGDHTFDGGQASISELNRALEQFDDHSRSAAEAKQDGAADEGDAG